ADVRNDFVTVGETHLGNLAQGGVRLLGGGGVYTSADTATLRAVFERGALAAFACDFARLARELTNGWHDLYASCCLRYASRCIETDALKLIRPEPTIAAFAATPGLFAGGLRNNRLST